MDQENQINSSKPENQEEGITRTSWPEIQEIKNKNLSAKLPQKKKKENRAFLGCVSALIGFIILVILGIILITARTGVENNPILKTLGINKGSVNEFFIQASNIIFGAVVFISFLIAIIGLFRFAMAKKDDSLSRRKGLVMAIFGSIIFIFGILSWVSVYSYLRTLIPLKPQKTLDYIVTIPEETIALTAPQEITFDASEIPYDEIKYEILSYQWDFGDSSPNANGPKVKHVYKKKGPDNGAYTVTLTIKFLDLFENIEETEQLTRKIIFENEKVSAVFVAIPSTGAAPLEVLFDASGSIDPDGEIVAYEWDFDNDGQYDDSIGLKPNWTFGQIGKYVVSLRVTDNNGEYATKEMEIEVTEPKEVTAVITSLEEGQTYFSGQSYVFDARNSVSPFGNIEKYEWDFGDGTKNETLRTTEHIFEKTGIYTVILKITDDTGQKGETSLEIIVGKSEEAPVPKVTTLPEYKENDEGQKVVSGMVPLKIQFDASLSEDPDENIVDYKWDFNGDGEIDKVGPIVTSNFEEKGKFNVTLFVIDAKNNQSTLKILVDLEEQGLLADLKAKPISGETPLTVEFDASGSTYPEGEIIGYEWNFGDGSEKIIGNAQISYRYEKIGTFEAKVNVLASDGKKEEKLINITVRPVAVTACFEVNTKDGDAPLTVTFDPGCSKGTLTRYTWDFGGETSRERKPTHTFINPGTYEVTLEVADNQNIIDRFTDTIIVSKP